LPWFSDRANVNWQVGFQVPVILCIIP
jgi:hypothetical protein